MELPRTKERKLECLGWFLERDEPLQPPSVAPLNVLEVGDHVRFEEDPGRVVVDLETMR